QPVLADPHWPHRGDGGGEQSPVQCRYGPGTIRKPAASHRLWRRIGPERAEDHAVPAGCVHVFADPVEQAVRGFEDEAVVVGVVVAVGQSRRHGLLYDRSLAVGVEPVESDGDVSYEETGEVLGEEAHDRLLADQMAGAPQRDGGGVLRWREPLSVVG